MPARIVVVHDAPYFAEEIATVLRAKGRDVAAFTDPMSALSALESAEKIQLLAARAEFQPGKPNGVSLALMARLKRPGILTLLTGPQEIAHHAEGIGEFLPAPVTVEDFVVAIERLLDGAGTTIPPAQEA